MSQEQAQTLLNDIPSVSVIILVLISGQGQLLGDTAKTLKPRGKSSGRWVDG